MQGKMDKVESDPKNTLRILIATDCHLGYKEKDPERGEDSLNTFEEILQHAQRQEVDMVLLGGDLFHENKPSRKILHGCMALIRKYCMGERPVHIEFLSDQAVNFAASPFPVVNYKDPNLKVQIPVFTIHGNHDDPAGLGNLSALNILSVSGLVNYFGKSETLESVEISPLLMKKGRTKLALYGLGSIRDERLHRMFVEKKIKLKPEKDQDSWFNIFVIHQNRAGNRGETNYIPEEFLPDFLNLVVWGHEHDCKIKPVKNVRKGFYITQPGSSVRTSLAHGEAIKKHVTLLGVKGKKHIFREIPLETVRPFCIEDVVLSGDGKFMQMIKANPNDPKISEYVEDYCEAKVDSLIAQADAEHSGNAKQPKLPLIRLRVDCSGEFDIDTFSPHRFGQKFVDRVANPKDIILFQRNKAQTKGKESTGEMANSFRPEDLVLKYLAEEKNKLSLLSGKDLVDAVQEFVDKEEKDAIRTVVNHQLEGAQQREMRKRQAGGDSIDEPVHKPKRKKSSKEPEKRKGQKVFLKKEQSQTCGETAILISDEEMDSAGDSDSEAGTASTSSRVGERERGRVKAEGQEDGNQNDCIIILD
ncbi:double-strand break repair protein MRE11-like isoform X2 [Amphiura filiformis]